MNSVSTLNLRCEAAPGPVDIRILDTVSRYNLRVNPKNLKTMSQHLGIELPKKIGKRVDNGKLRAICLGPDEWLIMDIDPGLAENIGKLSEVYSKLPHSITNISDREVTIDISGKQAAELLSVGCPIDLENMNIGDSRRTVFDGVQTVLHKDDQNSFQIDIWRSFVAHVWHLLNTANLELGAELSNTR